MCTLILAWQLAPGHPLIVGANRDEMLARKASGPRVVEGPPRALMPRDEVAGGSWLGLNEHGLFVGITNRAGAPPDPSRASRGTLVVEALRAPGAEALHQQLADLPADRFNPFHLLYADARAAFVTWSDGRSIGRERLRPGLHVVTERSLGGDDRGRAERVRRLYEERLDGRAPTVEALRELLVIHDEAQPLAGTCVHADAFGYGTRSSFIYLATPRPFAFWREGHPCEGRFEELDGLLEKLFRDVDA